MRMISARQETGPSAGAAIGRTWRDRFHRFSVRCSDFLGAPASFLIAVLVVAGWLLSGPVFRYSDSWQLVINTATTIVTFLMVFLIQNTQTRDAKALHLKLDELIRANRRARNELIDLESMTESELRKLENEFHALRAARAGENGVSRPVSPPRS
jgi:low affinity Fe/Cu permease